MLKNHHVTFEVQIDACLHTRLRQSRHDRVQRRNALGRVRDLEPLVEFTPVDPPLRGLHLKARILQMRKDLTLWEHSNVRWVTEDFQRVMEN